MPTYDYAQLRDEVVYPIIKRYGVAVSLQRVEDTVLYEKVYNPVTMKYTWKNTETEEIVEEKPEEVTATYSGICVITDYTDEEINGTTIKQGDKRLLLIGTPKPELGDIFTIGEEAYQYIFCKPISPANIDVVYKVQVRV